MALSLPLPFPLSLACSPHQAHRLSRTALESPCLTESDCIARLADHTAAARAFQVAAASITLEDESGLKALAQLKEQHTQAAEAIRLALAISRGHASPAATTAASAASTKRHLVFSGAAFANSAAFVTTQKRDAAASSSASTAAGSNNLFVLQLVQIVQVFLVAPAAPSSAAPTMSYAQLQAVLQQLRDLAGQLSSAASSLAPVSSLPPADEERVGAELRRKLAVAEELHQYLARLVAQGEGLSASALAQFHQRFIRLQQAQFDIARSEIVMGAQLSAGSSQLHQQSKQLSEKIGRLIQMISDAAKQAQVNETNAAASSATAAAAASSASSAEAQVKQLQEDKRALEKQLALLQRQVTLEKASRAKAEKAVEKHEQRWQALNEKVAEKKKAQLAAAVAGASAATAAASGATPQEISSATSASAVAAAAASSAASSSSNSSSGSLAKPPTARAVSTPSAPVSLHAARPVQLR